MADALAPVRREPVERRTSAHDPLRTSTTRWQHGVMNEDLDNETCLVEDAGHAIIEKKAAQGHDALLPIERLIYCLWVADYGMRNAGDLDAAGDLYEPFQAEGHRIAEELSLPHTQSAFGLSKSDLEGSYFDVFNDVCEELKRAFA